MVQEAITELTPALQGVRVVDFSQGVAGPHAGMILAQHGADVIKVEPAQGDWSRDLGSRRGNVSAYGLNFNLGKRSLILDLKSEKGQKIARELTANADIVIEAYRPGVMARLGLGYAEVQRQNPGVVYLSVTGFGQSGSNAGLPATDIAIQGYAGMMTLNQDQTGLPKRFPMIVVDIVTGLYGVQAVLAALAAKRVSGKGRHIDCSLMHCSLALQAAPLIEHQFEGGMQRPLYAPLGAMKTSDGYVCVSVRTDKDFAALCRVIGRAELADDPRFAQLPERIENENTLMRKLGEAFLQRSTADWVVRLVKGGIVHSVVRGYEDVLRDSETARSGFSVEVTQPGLDLKVTLPTVPGTVDGACPQVSPSKGEHTEIVLSELGMAASEIARLREQGIVA